MTEIPILNWFRTIAPHGDRHVYRLVPSQGVLDTYDIEQTLIDWCNEQSIKILDSRMIE